MCTLDCASDSGQDPSQIYFLYMQDMICRALCFSACTWGICRSIPEFLTSGHFSYTVLLLHCLYTRGVSYTPSRIPYKWIFSLHCTSASLPVYTWCQVYPFQNSLQVDIFLTLYFCFTACTHMVSGTPPKYLLTYLFNACVHAASTYTYSCLELP